MFQWVAEKQKEFQVNSMQLLYYQAPLCATTLMVLVPFFEPVLGPKGIFGPWPLEAMVRIFMANFKYFFYELSIFL